MTKTLKAGEIEGDAQDVPDIAITPEPYSVTMIITQVGEVVLIEPENIF